MRSIYTFLFLLFTSMGTLFSQTIPANVSESFRSGKASMLSPNLADKVTVIFPGMNRETDRKNSEQLLEGFFSGSRPSGFEILHKSEQGDSGFTVGKLSTPQGTYRVHLLFRNQHQKFLIYQIRIDKFNE